MHIINRPLHNSLIGLSLVLVLLAGTPGLVQSAPGEPPCPPERLLQDGTCETKVSGPLNIADPVAPSPSGGPDVYGYTWDATVTYDWKIADPWTELFPITVLTGTIGVDDDTAEADLPFLFPFYESAYDHVYISSNGVIGFDDSVSAKSHSIENLFMPFDYQFPQDFIAPFWDELAIGGGYEDGYNDGSLRVGPGSDVKGDFFVVEWDQVTRKFEDKELTFQAVLYQDGDILLQYQTLEAGATLDSCTIGIEDQDGVDGLQYLFNASGLVQNEAILISRPVGVNRVKFFPLEMGARNVSGFSTYQVYLRNTGEVGNDLYNLTTTSSDPGNGWNISLHDGQSGLPLGDTEPDGAPDTGTLAMGETFTMTVKIRAPMGVQVGASTTYTVTATTDSTPTKTRQIVLTSAVPTDHALLYRDGTQVFTDFTSPDVAYTGVGHHDYSGSDFALSNPSLSGTYVSFREKSRVPPENEAYTDLEFTVLSSTGQIVKGPWILWYETFPNLPSGFHPWRDLRPAVAVATNGYTGVAWIREKTNVSNGNLVQYSVYFGLLDPNYHLVRPPGNEFGVINVVTSNWYDIRGDRLDYQSVRLVATHDNRFYLTWVERQIISGRATGDLSHAVYDAVTGAKLLSPMLITDRNFLDKLDYWDPVVAAYQPPAGSPQVILAYVFRNTTDPGNPVNQIKYRLNSTNGSTVGEEQLLYAVNGEGLDITQMSNDNVAFAWTDPETNQINYTIRGPDLTSDLSGRVSLANPDNRKGGAVSVTYDDAGRAVLTWMDIKWFGRLYYALVDHEGVITPPVTIKYTQYNLETALQTRVSLGNAAYTPWYRISLPIVVR